MHTFLFILTCCTSPFITSCTRCGEFGIQ